MPKLTCIGRLPTGNEDPKTPVSVAAIEIPGPLSYRKLLFTAFRQVILLCRFDSNSGSTRRPVQQLQASEQQCPLSMLILPVDGGGSREE